MGLFLLEFIMNKTHLLSVLFSLFLVACSKQPPPFESYGAAQQSIKSLNTALKPVGTASVPHEQVLPFSSAYLSLRHQMYQRLQTMTLSNAQTQQLNYLIIAERFPERFFSWPAQVNVLENLLSAQMQSTKSNEVIAVSYTHLRAHET